MLKLPWCPLLTILIIHWKNGLICSHSGRSLSSRARDTVNNTYIILLPISFAPSQNFLSGFQDLQVLTSIAFENLTLFFPSKNPRLSQILTYWLFGNQTGFVVCSLLYFHLSLNALASYGINLYVNQNHSKLPELLLTYKYHVLSWDSTKLLKSQYKPKVYDKSSFCLASH